MRKVWIRDFALYVPKTRVGYREISRANGLPPLVVRDKQGIVSKPIERRLSTSEMSVRTVRALVRRNPGTARTVEFLVYAGAEFKDHYIWTAGPKIGWEALHRDVLAFDISSQCVGSLVGVDFAKSKLQTSPNGGSSAVVTVSTKQSMLVNYSEPRLAFINDFSDGSVSILLASEGGGRYEVLQSSFVTDGRFSEVIYAPFGERHTSAKEGWDYRTILKETRDWRDEMQGVSASNFERVILGSLEKSGFGIRDVAYLAMLHMKRSFHEKILRGLGVPPDRTTYLDRFGHMQGADPFVSLHLAERRHKLREGDVVVLVSAGTGWTWGATTLVAGGGSR